MNDIITIKTSSSFSTKRKVEINPKIIELLKNGEDGNIMVILPKGKSGIVNSSAVPKHPKCI